MCVCVCVFVHTHTHTQAAMGQTKRITTFGAVCGVTVRSSPRSSFFFLFSLLEPVSYPSLRPLFKSPCFICP